MPLFRSCLCVHVMLVLLIVGLQTASFGQSLSPEEQKEMAALNAIISNPATHDTSLAAAPCKNNGSCL